MIKYIQATSAAGANELLSQVYPQIKRDFGALVEPFTLHSPAPQVLAGVWIATRETELVGNARREIKEAVAASVSQLNQCPYCEDAHTMMLHASAAHDIAAAISSSRSEQIEDPALRETIAWAAATLSPGDPRLLEAPFSAQDAPEIIGTAIMFHYINRMANIFLDDTPLPSNRSWLKGTLKRLAGWYFSRAARRKKEAGISLALLPAADLPADLDWAADSPSVSGAFARLAAVIETAGQNALPESARLLTQEYVGNWQGESPGLSRGWVEEAIAGLDEAAKPAARLALLTAIAAYQIDRQVIDDFRIHHPGDRQLIEASAWASFTAARRIGRWLK